MALIARAAIRRALIAAALGAAIAASISAPAHADESNAARRAQAARERDRPYAMAEVGAGFIALPGALVCPRTLDACTHGEFSLAFGLRNVYRYYAFGFGAGIQWATTLRSDAARGAGELERDHTRRYFLVEGTVRYYAVRAKSWEGWAGATFGGVVVNDSWSVKVNRKPYSDTAFVGPRAATLGTEGLSLGISAGGEWSFASNWSLGPMIRYSMWFLPSTRQVSPTNDVASISGRVDMFDVGLAIAYRIAL